ncbi:MAG: hypothetical protein IT424_14090 [Pirellulales bacterium]|nr:hypothetical protein [Pirellulales bacterium]
MWRNGYRWQAFLGVLPVFLWWGPRFLEPRTEEKPAQDAARVAQATDDAQVVRRVYAVGDLVVGWPLTEKSSVDFESLVELLETTIAPGSWDDRCTVKIDKAHFLLIITQTRGAHREINNLMSQLREVSERYLHRIDSGRCGHCSQAPLPEDGKACVHCGIRHCDPF